MAKVLASGKTECSREETWICEMSTQKLVMFQWRELYMVNNRWISMALLKMLFLQSDYSFAQGYACLNY